MLHYVTTNPGKLREARTYLGERIAGYDYDYTEIQSPALESIAAHGAREAAREVGGPVIVDDAGLFVDGLAGFPGPYSSYVENTLGIERVWELAGDLADRRAEFRCVLAYCAGSSADGEDNNGGIDGDVRDSESDADRSAIGVDTDESARDDPEVTWFTGVVSGTLVAPRGEGGFGYDPIFEHEGRTFAEMAGEEKNTVSHRGRALEAFAAWFDDR